MNPSRSHLSIWYVNLLLRCLFTQYTKLARKTHHLKEIYNGNKIFFAPSTELLYFRGCHVYTECVQSCHAFGWQTSRSILVILHSYSRPFICWLSGIKSVCQCVDVSFRMNFISNLKRFGHHLLIHTPSQMYLTFLFQINTNTFFSKSIYLSMYRLCNNPNEFRGSVSVMCKVLRCIWKNY